VIRFGVRHDFDDGLEVQQAPKDDHARFAENAGARRAMLKPAMVTFLITLFFKVLRIRR
jgi:hypothetical protein